MNWLNTIWFTCKIIIANFAMYIGMFIMDSYGHTPLVNSPDCWIQLPNNIMPMIIGCCIFIYFMKDAGKLLLEMTDCYLMGSSYPTYPWEQ